MTHPRGPQPGVERAVEPDAPICTGCGSLDVETTGETQDAIAIWRDVECQRCGATGTIERRRTGTDRYHGDVESARRRDQRERSYHTGP